MHGAGQDTRDYVACTRARTCTHIHTHTHTHTNTRTHARTHTHTHTQHTHTTHTHTHTDTHNIYIYISRHLYNVFCKHTFLYTWQCIVLDVSCELSQCHELSQYHELDLADVRIAVFVGASSARLVGGRTTPRSTSLAGPQAWLHHDAAMASVFSDIPVA